MANTTISIRSSGDTGVTPSLGVIANGELALNFADGILYYKTASNTLGTITTTEPAGLNKEIQFNDSGSLGSNAGLTFDKTTGTFTVPSLNVASVYSLPVTDGTNGQLLTTDGSGTITFQDPAIPPANVSISTFSGTGDGSTVTYNLGYYPVSKEALLATIGGVLQDPSTAYTINQSNNTISFTSPPANTAPISVVSLYTNVTPIGPADVIVSNFITTANGVADTFDLGFNVTSANNLTVAVDGVLQTPTLHYTVNTTANTITFDSIPPSSSNISVVSLYTNVNTYADVIGTAAYAHANGAFDAANTSQTHAEGAFTLANTNATNITTAQGHADGAFTHANGAFDAANTAQTHADGAFTQANTAQTTADNAQTHAESAYTQANTNASDITTTNNRLNSAFGHANAAYTQANTATTDAGSAQTHAEGAFTQANTNATNITTAQNHADGAFTHANGAFDAANTKFASAGGTITGDTTITGNLTVTGTRTFANTVDTLITDNIVTLNAAIGQASAPTLDAGIEIDRGSSANVLLLWNETSDKWTFTNDGSTYYEIPTNTSVTTAQGHADGAFTHANGAFDKANTAQTHADGSFGHANGAFDAANTAQTHAEGAFTQANTNSTTDYTNVSITAGDYGSEVIIPVVHLEANGRVSSIANTSVRTGTTSVTGIVQLTDATNSTSTTTAATPNAVKSAYDLADTANTSATAAQSTADGAFTAANTAQSTADGAQTHAEGAFTQANTNASDITTAQNHANGAFNHANGAFGAANTAQTTADDAQTHAEGAFTQANTNASDITTTNSRLNSAFGHANSAFDTANTKFASAGGSISGDVSITGNLTVVGETVYANTTTALIADNIVTLNAAINQASAPASDAGLEIDRGSSANVSLLWNETSDKWTFTNDGSTYLPVADGDRLDSTFTHANGAFDAANTSQTHAEGAFTQANTNATNITTAQGHADGAFTHANGAFDKANTAQTHAEGAFTQANTNSTTDYTNVSVTGGTYGNASYIPSVTVEANGRVSSISTTAFSAATIGDILALSIALG